MNTPKNFSKALKILAAAPLLAGSMAANAALIEISYEGAVNYTSGDGVGYSIGDVVSGSLIIDTDLLPNDQNSSAETADYYQTAANIADFVTGGISNDTGLYDRLYISDRSYGFEQFYAMDRDYDYTYVDYNNRSVTDRYVNINAYGYGTDFLNGVTVEQIFDLNGDDLSYFGGTLYEYGYERVNGVQTTYDYGYAQFGLTNLALGPASVPAPTSLALLGLGLIGLGAARRRKTAPAH